MTRSALLQEADELAGAGRMSEAIDALTRANRVEPDPAIEGALVRLRHLAWSSVDRSGADERWTTTVPDLFAGCDGVPEVPAAELDGRTIHSAIQHHGALIARGLLSSEECERLRDGIDRSWEAIERFRETKERDPAWFDPFDTDRYGLTMAARAWALRSGTAYVPDSPRLLFTLLDAFERAGVKRVVTEYFGEQPALSFVKLAQRRLPPDANGGWHQDGAVYGMTARTLNVWTPVSRCGDVAPGLAMWPRRLDHMVGTLGTEGAGEFAAVDGEVATLTATVPAVAPVFEPGDAAIFDQFLLHQTAAGPDYREVRYGFESWFFAPSTYPDPNRWIPIVY